MPKRTINYFGQDVTLPATPVQIIDTAADIRIPASRLVSGRNA